MTVDGEDLCYHLSYCFELSLNLHASRYLGAWIGICKKKMNFIVKILCIGLKCTVLFSAKM